MSSPNETRTLYFGKHPQTMESFKGIAECIDFHAVERAYFETSYDLKKVNKVFRERFGFEMGDHPSINLKRPTSDELVTLAEKLYGCLNSISFGLEGTEIAVDMRTVRYPDEGDENGYILRKLAKAGMRKAYSLMTVRAYTVPQALPDSYKAITARLIAHFIPSSEYGVEYETEKDHGEPRRRIITLEQLSKIVNP